MSRTALAAGSVDGRTEELVTIVMPLSMSVPISEPPMSVDGESASMPRVSPRLDAGSHR